MNFEERNSYYEVLETKPSATLQDIHSAYNRARNAYSGDSAALYSLLTQAECDKILSQIEEAYSILGVPEKRQEYDKARGFNQENTPEGYNDKVMSAPSYKTGESLSNLLQESSEQINNEVENKALREEFQHKTEHASKNNVQYSKIQALNKFGLNYKVNQNFEQEIESTSEFKGDFLQKIREYKEVTVERMAEMTKISKTYIRYIEADEFTKLPADVYTRGFVFQYAKCLKLNPDLVAGSYLNHIKQLKSTHI